MNALSQTGLLMQWQARRQSQVLPLLIVVQILIAAATVIGYGLLVGDPTPQAALYLATGAPTITLITVGLVMAPQMVAQAKTEGSLDWMRTLPVPRAAFLVADLAIWTLLALPGMVLGIGVGAWWFGITLSVAWWLVPGALVVALTAAAVGYAMATLLPPSLAQLLTQVLIFGVLLFSPISYPPEHLPSWLQAVHEVLPIAPMAQLVRSGLASETFDVPITSLVVVGVWCAASVAGAAWALRRRV